VLSTQQHKVRRHKVREGRKDANNCCSSKQHSSLRGQPTSVPALLAFLATSFFTTIGATLCRAGSRAARLLDIFNRCRQLCCRLSICRTGRCLHRRWCERSCSSRKRRRLWHA
jgi:hypothetical protein